MRIIRMMLALAVIFSAGVSQAQDNRKKLLKEEFSPAAYNQGELRAIQRALVFKDRYDGLLDGEWGPRSQTALEAYARADGKKKATNRTVLKLMREEDDIAERLDWKELRFGKLGVEIGLPMKVMEKVERSGRLALYESEKQGLRILIGPMTLAEARSYHEEFADGAPEGHSPYLVRRDDRLVTSYRSTGGRDVYLRSDPAGGEWTTALLSASTTEGSRNVRRMASSLRFGPKKDWDAGGTPLFDALFKDEPKQRKKRAQVETRIADLKPGKKDAAKKKPADAAASHPPGGVAVYVNNTDLVTSGKLAKSCKEIRTSDGKTLRILTEDVAMGLAVLSGAGRSKQWLPVTAGLDDAKGQKVRLLGFANLKSGSPEPVRENRSVGSEKGPAGGNLYFTLVRGAKKGDLGSPVLTEEGALLGLISGGDAGELAVSRASIAEFLMREKIAFTDRAQDAIDLSGETPPQIARAIVPLICVN